MGWLLARKKGSAKRPPAEPKWSLDDPLYCWSETDGWTIGHAVEGTLVLGATGSGKSSGSGRALALSMLRRGFGGTVLTAKPGEAAIWAEYCRLAGRSDDLVIFGPQTEARFNFLAHEATRSGVGAGLTENLVAMFSTVLEVAERGGGSGREDESYWRRSSRQLCRNTCDLLLLSGEALSVPNLYRLITSAPTSREQLASAEWKERSFCLHCLAEADKREKSATQQADFELVADYFLVEWVNLSDRTRSVVQSTFTSMADVLNRGVLRESFCTTTNLRPDDAEQGRIIVIDFPVKEFAEVGQFAQVLWKYAFQRSIERRSIKSSPRPVFLFADEAQHFITSYDMQFQATCRSARVATVLLTQNYSNFIAALGGGEKGRAETDSLLANLNTKIFHANADPVTNEWAAGLIGRTRQFMANSSTSQGPEQQARTALGLSWPAPASSASAGFSETYEFEVQPREFTQLRTGGGGNRGLVTAILFQNGRQFRASGRSWLPVTFKQAGPTG